MSPQLNLIDLDEEAFLEQPDTDEDLGDLAPLSRQVILQAVVAGTDWTTETIISQIDKGNILLNPRFQRRDAWERSRKSRFIESLILGLPIPQLVLAESQERRGKYIVIDGKQRLLSIRQFSAKVKDELYSQLRLSQLDIRADLNGKSFEDLKQDPTFYADVASFENQPIRTVVIKNWQKEDLLYQIFLRLNTGSVPLSPQELRQALHPGEFVDFADAQSADSPALRDILKSRKPDFRMRDAELLIRYYAFRNFLHTYNGNLKVFLDLTCKQLNKQWDEERANILQQADEFEEAYKASRNIFGQKNVFRKWTGTSYQNRFNRAIFDVIMFYFSDVGIREAALEHKGEVEQAFKALCVDDSRFLAAIERTTKSLDATCTRLAIWAETLNNTLGTGLHIPRIVDNRIE